jgi:lipopolysaccharide/colanic/teichoic acid biosynthesis glycosyltransferase
MFLSMNSKTKKKKDSPMSFVDTEYDLYTQEYFNEMLCLERKRTERSKKHCILMLIDIEKLVKNKIETVRRITRSLLSTTRDTDIKGWYKHQSIVGVIFTEPNGMDIDVIEEKILNSLKDNLLSAKELKNIHISFYYYPEEPRDDGSNGDNGKFFPDISKRNRVKRGSYLLKRAVDIIGSVAALFLLLPVFVGIAILIKLSSKGPVFFKQERLGLHGKKFIFLKFRSMYVGNDQKIHQEYVKKLITSQMEQSSNDECVYKIANDTRVTPIGKILRKTSLDELPQFLNVLRGDMSLVGPRPPIPYEFDDYDIWHRRRVLEAKPGITGLWQVNGRSRTSFDDMVRLDLKYVREWNLWLDIMILLQTPRAVFSGKGAY